MGVHASVHASVPAGVPVSLELTGLLELIETSVGLRLQPQQIQALGLALEKVALAEQVTANALVEALLEGQQPELFAQLQSQFTISETHFYRIAPQIEVLKTTVLPELIARCSPQRRLRFWSAGCSSGEEVYTLLMLLEEIGGLKDWDVRVLGTDINPSVLELARTAMYGHWSFRDTPFAAIERFFHVSGAKYRIRSSLRKRAEFQVQNLLEPLFNQPAFDLIVCRNVTIYFAPQTAQRVYQNLAAQLLPGGWLILGPSDPPMQPATLKRTGLEMVLLPGVIVWKKPEHQGFFQTSTAILQKSKQSTIAPELQPEVNTSSATSDSSRPLWKNYLRDGYNKLLLEDYSTALKQFRCAVFLEPTEPLPHIGLAKACLGVRQDIRAISALRQAKRLLMMLEPCSRLDGCAMTCTDLLHVVDSLLEPLKPGAVIP